jgi:glycosyltransferase involved in cell wall biosynthesis
VKVVHISSRDIVGGASIAAYRLHKGLRQIGVDSEMFVDWKASDDANVHPVQRDWSRGAMLRRRIEKWRIRRDFERYRSTLSPTLELITDDRDPGGRDVSATLPDADAYNLHWVSGFVDYRRFCSTLPLGKPLVWTLHDMNPFTGGCHYTLGCDRFRERCGACPQLGSRAPSDLTSQIHARKTAAFAALCPETTRIVSSSRWLRSEARASELFRRFDVDCIPYSLDTDVFRPRDRAEARHALGLPQDGHVVLFGAERLNNYRKGFDLLTAALHGLSTRAPVTLACVGAGGPQSRPDLGYVPLGEISSEETMSLAMSAANLFVCPSRAEAFGQVVLESMACGTPVIGFDVGGVPDMVRPGLTGLLAPREDVTALRAAIKSLLDDENLLMAMSAACRQVVLDEYSLVIQARRYSELYDDLIAASARLPRRRSKLA